MKKHKHKHKESFSVLLISNTGQGSRQFHISLFSFRLLMVLLLLVCAVLGWYTYWFLTGHGSENALHEQILSQSQLIEKLEAEKEALHNENLTLTAENDALRQTPQEAAPAPENESAEEPEADSSIPSRYPYSASVILNEAYSDEHPYLSINTQSEGDIVAAGDGIIVTAGSDDTYPLVIEIDHGNGYRTRYMCMQAAQQLPEEGSQVHIGDALTAISTNTQLDYQVLFEEQPIDPLMVLEAKG